MFHPVSPPAPPIRTARSETERVANLVSRLKCYPQVDPARIGIVRVPLRICPLGAHIDHQLGQVTGMTIDQSILLAFAPTTDASVYVESFNFEPAVAFSLDNVPAYTPRDWGNYIRGAVLALQQSHSLQHGLIGVVEGEMPVGGLSSSAAVTIAYLLALQAVNHLEEPPEKNVALVRFTENHYIGLNNGILDQSVILFNQHEHLTFIDCQTFQVDRIPAAPTNGGFEILAVYSGVSRVLAGTDYNNRVAECREAARRLLSYAGQPDQPEARLRHVQSDIFIAEGHRLPLNLKRRASHYFGEMQRVQEGVTAWQEGNLSRFGALMSESGHSSISNYECGSPQLITLYEILRETPGVYGTRFSGAGFQGNCLALIDPTARETIAEAVHRCYPTIHPAEAPAYSIHFCQPDGPAQLYPVR